MASKASAEKQIDQILDLVRRLESEPLAVDGHIYSAAQRGTLRVVDALNDILGRQPGS